MLLRLSILCSVLLLAISNNSFAQSPAPTIGPVDQLIPGDNKKWIQDYFATQLSDVEIIGLGEVSHGAHEALAFKAEMVKYLIRDRNYRSFFLELPDASLRDLNSYLTDSSAADKQKLDTLFSKDAKGEIYNTDEIKDLLAWVKEFNLNHLNDRVSLRGMDIHVMFYYFRDHYIDTSYYSALKKEWKLKKIDALNPSQQLGVVNEWFKVKSSDLKKSLSDDIYGQLKQDLEDFRISIYTYENGGAKDSRMVQMRDSTMAQNVERLKSGKAIIWAHNAHIASTGFNLNRFKAVNLGSFLKKKYGNKYYVLLTDFSGLAQINVKLGEKIKLKSVKNNSKSAVSVIAEKYKLTSGMISVDQFKQFNIPYIFNNISVEGNSFTLGGEESAFNAIVFFNSLSPTHIIY